MFAEQYGPWAVIAGGSEGVGASFARRLAKQGVNLVLLARKPGPLAELSEEIRAEWPVEVRSAPVDLTADGLMDRVADLTHDIEVGLLIYNAGSVSKFGEFLDEPLEAGLRMMRLGVVAPTLLLHHFASRMRARRRGGIILVGSMAGYAGAPDEIVYSAGKAYSRMMAEGLWWELKPHNVHVLGLIMGLTRTPAMDRLGMKMDSTEFPPDEPDDVADQGLANLPNGPLWHVNGKEEGARQMALLSREQAVGFMAQGAKLLHG
jgi:short-subunit dehydrogenase